MGNQHDPFLGEGDMATWAPLPDAGGKLSDEPTYLTPTLRCRDRRKPKAGVRLTRWTPALYKETAFLPWINPGVSSRDFL